MSQKTKSQYPAFEDPGGPSQAEALGARGAGGGGGGGTDTANEGATQGDTCRL